MPAGPPGGKRDRPDHKKLTFRFVGRAMNRTDVGGRVVHAFLA
ncbi:MAG: hypothetical protein VB859_08735 [Planctomycetaceae bacterium]